MIQYLLTAIVFVILDGTYLNLVKGYFNKQIKSIQGSDIQMNIVATGLVYVVLIYGLNYFIIRRNKSVQEAALLGFFVYAVYELTNLEILYFDSMYDFYFESDIAQTLPNLKKITVGNTIIYSRP
jgi:uncharacterized membrane protein